MKKFRAILAALALYFTIALTCRAEESKPDKSEYRLTKKLLAEYDPAVRPASNFSHPLRVIFGVSLHHIIDVDEKNQILTTNCWITQVWTDFQLTWNISDYSGVKVIRIPYQNVWRPDTILYNNADSQYNTAVINTNVIVSHTGEVVWLSHGIYKSSCDIDVEYFPFDVQSCNMKWASWTYDGFQLDLIKQTEEGDTSNYQANGEFDLISFNLVRNVVNYSCCVEPYPDITYTITLRRRPMFYVFNLILPCILINCIALLVFYVPSESGEKVTLGISALLSMTVFLMTIRETLPPTEKTPLISMYYGVSICLVTFASGLSVVTLNVYHRGVRGTKVPDIVKNVVLDKLAKILMLHFENNEKREPTGKRVSQEKIASNVSDAGSPFVLADREISSFPTSPYKRRSSLFYPKREIKTSAGANNDALFLKTLDQVKESIERNERRLSEHEIREMTEREWKQVSLVCDRFLLFAFFVATAVTTYVILCRSPYT